MQVREKRTCSVVYSPVGTGNSLSGFFYGKMGGGRVHRMYVGGANYAYLATNSHAAIFSSEHINPLHKKSYMSFSLLAQFLLSSLFSIETEKDVLAGYSCA